MWEELGSLIEIANAKESEHIRTRPKKNKIDNTNLRRNERRKETKLLNKLNYLMSGLDDLFSVEDLGG